MTQYSKTQRQNLVKVFEAVKLDLWDGKHNDYSIKRTYICHAIQYIKLPGAYEAELLIKRRLKGALTLQIWLMKQGVPSSEITQSKIQAHRLAWLNLLIKEFSQ